MMGVTSIDCVAPLAQYLANVMRCPQLETTLVILIGQFSKYTNMLALNGTLAKHCLSDFQQILVSQGANDTLQHICSLHPSNLTEGSCSVKDVHEFENTVDSSSLLAACRKIDLVNECCEQTCQNAISEAAKKLALKAYDLLSLEGAEVLLTTQLGLMIAEVLYIVGWQVNLTLMVQKMFLEDYLIAKIIKARNTYKSFYVCSLLIHYIFLSFSLMKT